LERSHGIGGVFGISGITYLRGEPGLVSLPKVPVGHTFEYDSATNMVRLGVYNYDTTSTEYGPWVDARQGEMFVPGFIGSDNFKVPVLCGVIDENFTVTVDSCNLYISMINYLGTGSHYNVVVDLLSILPGPGAVTASDVVTAINGAFPFIIPPFSLAYPIAAPTKVCLVAIGATSEDSKIVIGDGPNNAAGAIFGVTRRRELDVSWDPTLTGISFVELYHADADAFAELSTIDVNYTAASTELTFQYAASGLSAAVDVSGGGSFTLEDVAGYKLVINVEQESLPAGNITATGMDVGYNREEVMPPQNSGLWIDVDLASLPGAPASDLFYIYDDSFADIIDVPDGWWYDATLDATAYNLFSKPSVLDFDEVYDPCKRYSYVIKDTTITNITFYGPVNKFPVTDDLPRGSNFPQTSQGLFYDYEGFTCKFGGYFRNLGTVDTDVTVGISFDEGVTWKTATSTILGLNDPLMCLEPTRIFVSTQIPSEISLDPATGRNTVWVEIKFATAAPGIYMSFDNVDTRIEYISSSAVGNNTVARSRHRQYYGELLWCWSPEPLSNVEKKYLGIFFKDVDKSNPISGIAITSISNATPAGTGVLELSYTKVPVYNVRWTPYGLTAGAWTTIAGTGAVTLTAPDSSTITTYVTASSLPTTTSNVTQTITRNLVISDLTTYQGHSRWISPSHSSLDVIDVTEYDVNNVPVNLFGAISESDFPACTLTNLSVSSADPFKYAYLYPAVGNQVGESLTWATFGPNKRADLDYHSDMDEDVAILYQDGLPVSTDLSLGWSFVDSNTITIPTASWSSSSVYTIDYNTVFVCETPVIDLGATFENYLWLADYSLWKRIDTELSERATTVPIYFSSLTNKAVLSYPSTMNKSLSKLYIETANGMEEITKSLWRFYNDITVQIDNTAFFPGQYYLYHYEQRAVDVSDISVTFEHRSDDTEVGVGVATYVEIERNENISTRYWVDDSTRRYHQLKITISGIRSVEDFRLRSVVMKGLNMYGSVPNIPGLTNLTTTL
jgi:hypothetical protein